MQLQNKKRTLYFFNASILKLKPTQMSCLDLSPGSPRSGLGMLSSGTDAEMLN